VGTTALTYHVRELDRHRVISAVAEVSEDRAYVSVACGGWISIVPERIAIVDPIAEDGFGSQLARRLELPALEQLIYDSDVTLYRLYGRLGELIDQYDSAPGFADGEGKQRPPSGGNVGALSQAFGLELDSPGMRAVLERPVTRGCRAGPEAYALEDGRLEAIAGLLRIPGHRPALKFKDLAAFDEVEGLLQQALGGGQVSRIATALAERIEDMSRFTLVAS
jgi:hypothetical protein